MLKKFMVIIIDSQGKYLAYGTSKQMVIPGLQTIAQALSAMGYKPLPPKFLSNNKIDQKH
jgi:hypothetical protein